MTNGPNLHDIEQYAQALRWLDLLSMYLPETVKFEVSSGLLIAVLVALWIWRRPG
jgi:hypothetical protein